MKLATSLLLATATAALKLEESKATKPLSKPYTSVWDRMTLWGTELSSEGSVKPINVRNVIHSA